MPADKTALPSPARPAGPGLRDTLVYVLVVYALCSLLAGVAFVAFTQQFINGVERAAIAVACLSGAYWPIVVVYARSLARHRRDAGEQFRRHVSGGTPLWCPREPLDAGLRLGGVTLAERYEMDQPGVLGLTHREVVFLGLDLRNITGERYIRAPVPQVLRVRDRASWPRDEVRAVEALPPTGLRMWAWGLGRVRLILERGHVDFPTPGAARLARLLREELAKPY